MSYQPLLQNLVTTCVADGRISINVARRIIAESETPAVLWLPIAGAPQNGQRLMLWDSVSKRPVFGSWRPDSAQDHGSITHYADEPAGPEAA